MRAVHASERHGLAREVAEAVVTDMADHAHGGTASSRGRGLVGALAAGRDLVARAKHRLARPRQGVYPEQQIDVDGAKHQEQS